MPPRAKSPLSTKRFNVSFRRSKAMKNDRKTDKKKETLRPWLVDVAVEHLR
jgi:hypothetical protein